METQVGEETLFKCCRCKELLTKENFHNKAYNKNHGIQYKCKICLKEIYRTNTLKNKYNVKSLSNVDRSKRISNTSVFENFLKKT